MSATTPVTPRRPGARGTYIRFADLNSGWSLCPLRREPE